MTVDLCPAHLSLAAVLRGQPPIDQSRPVIWAELGSGNGITACMVAAANANVQVWGCDFNPAHVERSRQLAAKAGLLNCTFDEATFEQVAIDEHLGPDQVDVIVAHGVYAWVSQQNHRHMAEFIRRRLRPGGYVYLSYDGLSGWASMLPLAEAMRLHVNASGQRSDLAFPDAAAAMHRLADGGSRYFPLGPAEAPRFAHLPHLDPHYAVHEFLVGHFRPLMFDEVVEAMASARCSYVGPIQASDLLAETYATPALTELVAGTVDVTLREMLRHLIIQRAFHRDVFRRGLAAPTHIEQGTWLNELVIVGLGKTLANDAVVAVAGGIDETPNTTFYRPLIEVLTESPLSVAGIRAIHTGLSLRDAVAALVQLVSEGFAAPQVKGWRDGEGRASARRLNQVLIAENRLGGDHSFLIAPAIGSSVSSDLVEMLAIGAVWEGLPEDVDVLAAHALAELACQAKFIVEDDIPVTDPNEALAVAKQRVTATLQRMNGVYRELGIC